MKQVGYSPLQTPRVSRPGEAYLHRATEAFGMRRSGRPSRFLVGVICATTGLGLWGEGLAMAVAPRHPVAGQVLFFVATVVPFTIFLTVLMVPRLGSLREITVAILGVYPALVYRMSSPLVLAGYDEHLVHPSADLGLDHRMQSRTHRAHDVLGRCPGLALDHPRLDARNGQGSRRRGSRRLVAAAKRQAEDGSRQPNPPGGSGRHGTA